MAFQPLLKAVLHRHNHCDRFSLTILTKPSCTLTHAHAMPPFKRGLCALQAVTVRPGGRRVLASEEPRPLVRRLRRLAFPPRVRQAHVAALDAIAQISVQHELSWASVCRRALWAFFTCQQPFFARLPPWKFSAPRGAIHLARAAEKLLSPCSRKTIFVGNIGRPIGTSKAVGQRPQLMA